MTTYNDWHTQLQPYHPNHPPGQQQIWKSQGACPSQNQCAALQSSCHQIEWVLICWPRFSQWRFGHQQHPKCVSLMWIYPIFQKRKHGNKIFIENTRTGCFGLVSNSPQKKRRKNTSWSIKSPVQSSTRLEGFFGTMQDKAQKSLSNVPTSSPTPRPWCLQKRFWEMHVNAEKSSVLMWWNVVI